MPPLRDRTEDIPLLVDQFLTKFCREYAKKPKTVAASLMHRFMKHRWDGNVRELENVISRAVLLSPGPEIHAEDIEWASPPEEECLVGSAVRDLPYKEAKARVLERFHHEYLADLFMRYHNNVTQAAKACGLERQALQQVMRRYGIKSGSLQPADEAERHAEQVDRPVDRTEAH
jgi:DNA-binding NtrC family response regulator